MKQFVISKVQTEYLCHENLILSLVLIVDVYEIECFKRNVVKCNRSVEKIIFFSTEDNFLGGFSTVGIETHFILTSQIINFT